MSESLTDIRKRSWETRRKKYGQRGHSGSYRYPTCLAEMNTRLRQAFVDGAKWWEFESTGGTMRQSDQHKAGAAALEKYR